MKELDKWIGRHSLRELARRLGIYASAINGWQRRGVVPADRIVQIERVTGIPREKLRPDLYAKQRRRSSPKSSR